MHLSGFLIGYRPGWNGGMQFERGNKAQPSANVLLPEPQFSCVQIFNNESDLPLDSFPLFTALRPSLKQ